jgi:hypothetical protein
MISERAFAKGFSSFWRELLPLLSPHFVALFNEAYQRPLIDAYGQSLKAIPLPAEIRPDIVAEFAFRGARLLKIRGLGPDELVQHSTVLTAASQEAFDVIQRYEGRKPAFTSLTSEEVFEGARIAQNYDGLYRAFPIDTEFEFCPRFPGAGFLSTAEGDLGIGDTLVEIKTTTRHVAGKDIRQLLTYLALDSNGGRQRWTHLAVFNPRLATLHRAEVDALILRLSGGKPRSDVFAELLAFAEASQLMSDARF